MNETEDRHTRQGACRHGARLNQTCFLCAAEAAEELAAVLFTAEQIVGERRSRTRAKEALDAVAAAVHGWEPGSRHAYTLPALLGAIRTLRADADRINWVSAAYSRLLRLHRRACTEAVGPDNLRRIWDEEMRRER